jgi:hypothetical protein
MSKHLSLSENPPASAEDAILRARQLLKTLGIAGATVSLVTPATKPGGLIGAALHAALPIRGLEELARQAVTTAAAEQGLKVTHTTLKLEQAGANRLHLSLHAEAKIFGGTLQIGVEGYIAPENGTHLRFSGLQMEGGGGIFGGIASSMIRPKLTEMEASPLDLQRLAGVPLELTELKSEEDNLVLYGTFTEPPPLP